MSCSDIPFVAALGRRDRSEFISPLLNGPVALDDNVVADVVVVDSEPDNENAKPEALVIKAKM